MIHLHMLCMNRFFFLFKLLKEKNADAAALYARGTSCTLKQVDKNCVENGGLHFFGKHFTSAWKSETPSVQQERVGVFPC